MSKLETFGFIRVAAITPALILGKPAENRKVIERLARKAAADGCRIAVFPELCLTGYSCGDLFYQFALREEAATELAALARRLATTPMVIVVGLPVEIDGRLYNTAAVLGGGRVCGLVPKTYLPNACEFYERRWFSPAPTLSASEFQHPEFTCPIGTDLLFQVGNAPHLKLGIEICEDLWAAAPPSSRLALAGATVIANPSASDEVLGKCDYRRHLVSQQAARCHAAYVYAAAGPGESSTDIVYSGHNLISENGTLLAESARFQFEDQIITADLDLEHLVQERLKNTSFRDGISCEGSVRTVLAPLPSPAASTSRHQLPLRRPLPRHPFIPASDAGRNAVCNEIFAIQSTGLARRLAQAKARTAVIGLSGGLDSTLALLVIVDALRRHNPSRCKVLAVTMPGFGTTKRTKSNAQKLAASLGIELRSIPIGPAVKQHFADIGHPDGQHDVTFENAQARERTQILMDIANKTGGLVVGTGDLSEAALGWCTFNGDHMSMYHVNAGVPKTLVKYVICWCADEKFQGATRKVLHDIIDTPISPELLPPDKEGAITHKTEDILGPYEIHDFFLFYFVRHGFSSEKIAFLAEQAFRGTYTAKQIHTWLDSFRRRFFTNQFKRSSMPDGPKVGSVALSPRGDWRMPSDISP